MYSREPGVARAELGPTGMRQAKGGAEERGLKGSWPGHSDLGSPAAQTGGDRAKTGPCSPPHLCTRLFFLPFLPEVGKPPGLPQLRCIASFHFWAKARVPGPCGQHPRQRCHRLILQEVRQLKSLTALGHLAWAQLVPQSWSPWSQGRGGERSGVVLSCKSHSSSSRVDFQQLCPSSWVGLDSSQRPQENIQTRSGGFGQATDGEEVLASLSQAA